MYRKSISRKAVTATLLTIVSLAVGMTLLSSGALAHHETTLVVDAENPEEIRTDGESIIWSRSGEEAFRDVFLTAISTGETTLIVQGDIPVFDVSGDRLVWLDRQANEIHLLDSASGESRLLAHNVVMWAHQQPLNIEGDWVVWVEVDEETRLMAQNLSTSEEFVVDQAASISGRLGYNASIGLPVLSEGNVYWRGERTDSGLRDLMVRNLETGEQDVIMGFDASSSVNIVGDSLITRQGRYLSVHNMTTGESKQLTSQARQSQVDASGMVFWEERRRSGTRMIESLHGWDAQRDELLDLRLAYMSVPIRMEFAAEHGMLVWSGIHAVEIETLRQGDAWQYFPETGQYVRFGLLNFWSNNGSIPVFGYPMTDQFGNAQYFERQRLEEHPQHLGTPYDIQLGLLGSEEAQSRNLFDTEPFQALPEDTESDDHCHFFPETGHRLCHGFLSYWQSNGLELGDEGLSFRESLALFGYPISEEYVDPDTGLVTQYFQRARFEYHPENEAPWDILLGRLGADLVNSNSLTAGWPRE